jgi:hypothetical protein
VRGRRCGPAAGVLQLLGRRPSGTVTAIEAATLLGQPAAKTSATLEALADASLLVSPAPGTYLLPALARLFAAEYAQRPAPRQR